MFLIRELESDVQLRTLSTDNEVRPILPMRRIVAAESDGEQRTMATSYTASGVVYGHRHPPLPLPRDREYDDGYYLADYRRCGYCGHLAYIHRSETHRCLNTTCDCLRLIS